jgi:hypothetical protein
MADYQRAIELVKELGRDGEIDKHSYRDWPLFKEFTKNQDFCHLIREHLWRTTQHD